MFPYSNIVSLNPKIAKYHQAYLASIPQAVFHKLSVARLTLLLPSMAYRQPVIFSRKVADGAAIILMYMSAGDHDSTF